MRIFLTCDVHNWIGNREHVYIKKHLGMEDEFEVMQEWLEIANSHHLKSTLFITGKFANIHRTVLKKIYDDQSGRIEFGGHTYSAFYPNWLFYPLKAVSSKRYGPRWYQKLDIQKTLQSIESITNTPLLSWRTHEYNGDPNTYDLLGTLGVKVISDGFEYAFAPKMKNGMVFQPINTLPDHENLTHISHSNDTGMSPDAWLDRIKRAIIEKDGTDANIVILAHPTCMKLSDDFQNFRKLCSFLSGYQTCNMKDLSV